MTSKQKYNIVILSDDSRELFMTKMLGPYKIACELRNAGFDVQVIDHLHIFSVAEIKEILKKAINKHTLFVGVNSFLYANPEKILSAGDNPFQEGGIKFSPKEMGSIIPHGIKYNQEIVDTIKNINPCCKLVLGGPDGQDFQHVKVYDYVINGYADLSVVNLAKHLAYGEELKKSRRSIWGPVIIQDSKAEGYDFSNSLMQYQANDFILPGESLYIEIARGCIFQCKFCSYPLNGKTKNDYIKLQEILYQEFTNNYNQFGVTRYLFSDDTFNDSKEKLQMMYDISKKLPFQLEYWAYIRLDLLAAHPENISLLFDSGCRGCFFGIETLYEKTGKVIGKGGNRSRLIDTIKYIKQTYGNKVMLNGGFIFGLPYEPVESMLETTQQLLLGETGLDSWESRPLYITAVDCVFSSDIDKNYEKYGYVNQGTVHGMFIDWVSENTNFREVTKLAEDLNDQSLMQGKKINSIESFFIASLGTNLEFSGGQLVKLFDWHQVDLMKQSRAKEYKKKLFDFLGIDTKITVPYLGEHVNEQTN
jgi:radical SAM superfamily enzyme YgiQ (UPF0313 family)